MKMRDILSGKVFIAIAVIFIIGTAVATCVRGGKDMNVGLFGVEQMLQRHSPYDNPTDANRPIFRYAPGFTLLQAPFKLASKMVGPFEFKNMLPSIFAWYVAGVASLFLSVFILLRLVPAPSREAAMLNMKISLLLASPLIAYELSNSQNKLMALAFVLLAVYLFEKNKYFLSAIALSVALTIYSPLFFFVFYFILRSRGRYIASLALGGLTVFVIVPSLFWGIDYNNFVLMDWYERCLKPFAATGTYNTYMELRQSSQSLPSAIGRILVYGRTTPYKYAIPPEAIHSVIRAFSTAILAISLLTVWRRVRPGLAGLACSVFLLLALIMPSYCIWYTWAWSFVFFFTVLNYLGYPGLGKWEKNLLWAGILAMVIADYSIMVKPLNEISVPFAATLVFWACISAVILKRSGAAE